MVDLSIPLHNEVFDPERSRLLLGRTHIFALITFARVIYWDKVDLRQAYLLRFVASSVYWRNSPKTLRAHRARWLKEISPITAS